MLHCFKPLLAVHEPCIDKLRPYNIYHHLGGGGMPRHVWSGGGLVGFWWDGVVFHCLGFRLVGGILVGFSNGILMKVLMSSVGVPFGSFAGVSLVRRGSGWWGVILFVPLELCRFLVVSACGVAFSLFYNDLLNILIKSLHRVLARQWDRVKCL